MSGERIIDSHMHCGIQNVNQPYEVIHRLMQEAGIGAACMFAPVEDIYNRCNFNFTDTPLWQQCRSKANRYIRELADKHPVYPYFFVWNDFNTNELTADFKGIKWHRHFNEPVYNYNDPRCEVFLRRVYELYVPVVLEEEYKNTLTLVARINRQTPVIIPHMGGLNGGYEELKRAGIWEADNVYADTALASKNEIRDFIAAYGVSRLLFGSDFPFGRPLHEKQKLLELKLNPGEREAVFYGNIAGLLKISGRS